MTDWSQRPRTAEFVGVDRPGFVADIQPLARPAVLRGLVADWPAVAKARQSDEALCDYLRGLDSGAEADGCFGSADMGGRFFYDANLTGFNFERRKVRVSELLDFLLDLKAAEQPAYGYTGAVRIKESLPGFLADNPSPLVDPHMEQLNSIWIGNRTRISAHWDLPQNLICAVGGRRRYILFPPEQLANLYCGPLDFTPAGQPISLVDFHAPDLSRFPRFSEAMQAAEVAELEPGDALYLPSLWWHHAESLDPVGVMVNYWWRDEPAHAMSPKLSVLHALMTIRQLPAHERLAWRAFFDHYIFAADEEAATAHIPERARGVLATMSPELAARLRSQLGRSLNW
ncbi:MAG: cupin-like domain-containing protein [Pseudomarimonas sp.]